MPFKLDQQTIDDLDIFGDYRSKRPSLYTLFNKTFSHGGADYLKNLLMSPTNDLAELKRRGALISYLMQEKAEPQLNRRQFDFIQRYVTMGVPLLKTNPLDLHYRKLVEWIRSSNYYYLIKTAITELLKVLKELHVVFKFERLPNHLKMHLDQLEKLIHMVSSYWNQKSLSTVQIARIDMLLRKKYVHLMSECLEQIYLLDAYLSIARVARENDFVLPEYSIKGETRIVAVGIWHPLLKNAVANDLCLDGSHNLCFLTGSNMAGKSTFLKSLGIVVYLAHVGLPVPARRFYTSLYDGIMTTVNLSDNLDLGFSHYYSEVSRVKEAAVSLSEGFRMLIIFDELFRGTNVKDALEASTAIVKSFAEISSCTFLMSTHIVEIAEEVNDQPSIIYRCFESQFDGAQLNYSYKIKEGVSAERLGMYIIEREGIWDLLHSLKT